MIWNIKNDLHELSTLSEGLEVFGKEAHMPHAVVSDITLALEEVIINIISYGYNDCREHRISVRLDRKDSAVMITVEDDGEAFDPLTIPSPNLATPLSERKIGGLGIHLVRQLMNTLAYQRVQGKNSLIMTKIF